MPRPRANSSRTPANLAAQRVGALMVGADPFFNSQRNQLAALVARYRFPAIYEIREFAAAGGLLR
jgi:putative tryptophan/tyrosine transport system substrate-binding protein